MTDLKSMNLQEIEELISSLNCPKFRAKQIFQWINKGVTSFDEMKKREEDMFPCFESIYSHLKSIAPYIYFYFN